MHLERGFIRISSIGIIAVLFLGAGAYLYERHSNDRGGEPAGGDRFLPSPISKPEVLEDRTKAEEIDTNNTAVRDKDKTTIEKEVVRAAPVEKSMPEQQYYDPGRHMSQSTTCSAPFIFNVPIDISKATAVLYPGQERNGDYKAHGGFRFDHSRPDEISVLAPIDAAVIAGAKYPVNGELQYTFDFENSCGIRYRLGHLLKLTPKFQAIAERFPLPTTLDSRTTEVYPPISIKKDEVIAIAVGLMGIGVGGTGQSNTFVDWGVYDYREKNEASKDPIWAASHTADTYQYAVCWFDWISPENKAFVLALPAADGVSGTKSDYCK